MKIANLSHFRTKKNHQRMSESEWDSDGTRSDEVLGDGFIAWFKVDSDEMAIGQLTLDSWRAFLSLKPNGNAMPYEAVYSLESAVNAYLGGRTVEKRAFLLDRAAEYFKHTETAPLTIAPLKKDAFWFGIVTCWRMPDSSFMFRPFGLVCSSIPTPENLQSLVYPLLRIACDRNPAQFPPLLKKRVMNAT